MMVDDKTLNDLLRLGGEDLSEAIFDLEEEGELDATEIDKSWDGLHFILTGQSATEPIEGNRLSEAVVGVQLFSGDGDSDFISYTERSVLGEIVAALEAVDVEKLKQNFNPSALAKADLYPDIWEQEEKGELFDYLEDGYKSLLVFYKEALASNMNVVVSIL